MKRKVEILDTPGNIGKYSKLWKVERLSGAAARTGTVKEKEENKAV